MNRQDSCCFFFISCYSSSLSFFPHSKVQGWHTHRGDLGSPLGCRPWRNTLAGASTPPHCCPPPAEQVRWQAASAGRRCCSTSPMMPLLTMAGMVQAQQEHCGGLTDSSSWAPGRQKHCRDPFNSAAFPDRIQQQSPDKPLPTIRAGPWGTPGTACLEHQKAWHRRSQSYTLNRNII